MPSPIVDETADPNLYGPSTTPRQKSPASSPRLITTETGMTFSNALEAIRDGKRVARIEWQDPEYYCLMDDQRLCLHKPDGKIYSWIINDGDMAGEDWVVL